jgi:hypothetical protein
MYMSIMVRLRVPKWSEYSYAHMGTVDEHICMYLNAEMDDGPTHSGPSRRSRAQ